MAIPSDQELLDAIRAHALANYNTEGWDYLVECWEDDYILDCLDGVTEVTEAIDAVRDALSPLNDMRDEVRASGEW